jgi:PAS domain S-box-containing protein
MTQRRRIAIAYLFAVPAVLAIVLVQHIALLRLRHAETEMVRTSGALLQPGAAFSTAQSAGKGGSAVQTGTASEAQGQSPAAADAKLAAETTTAAQRTRLLDQRAIADRSVRFAEAVNTFGGVLAIWLVGVAAFLLFHDERARAWTGVERRVHTRIIETLPLGVCLSTVAGGILYANPAEDAIFGYGREELIGRDVARLHGPLPADPGLTVEETIDRLGPGQTWSGEVAVNRKDGATVTARAWITNMEVAGKLYRLFVHNPAN